MTVYMLKDSLLAYLLSCNPLSNGLRHNKKIFKRSGRKFPEVVVHVDHPINPADEPAQRPYGLIILLTLSPT